MRFSILRDSSQDQKSNQPFRIPIGDYAEIRAKCCFMKKKITVPDGSRAEKETMQRGEEKVSKAASTFVLIQRHMP